MLKKIGLVLFSIIFFKLRGRGLKWIAYYRHYMTALGYSFQTSSKSFKKDYAK